jgi:hypothetical protein
MLLYFADKFAAVSLLTFSFEYYSPLPRISSKNSASNATIGRYGAERLSLFALLFYPSPQVDFGYDIPDHCYAYP